MQVFVIGKPGAKILATKISTTSYTQASSLEGLSLSQDEFTYVPVSYMDDFDIHKNGKLTVKHRQPLPTHQLSSSEMLWAILIL